MGASADTDVAGARQDENAPPGNGFAYAAADASNQKIVASDGTAGDVFGNSISISGDNLIVGAPWDTPAGVKSGSVYAFSRGGGIWGGEQRLTAPSGAAGEEFGFAVAVDGTTLVAGAPFNSGSAGRAVVFTSGAGWGDPLQIVAGDAAGDDLFGRAVAVSGPTIAVGAPGDDSGKGSVYIFGPGTCGATWCQLQKITASDGAAADWFGISVGLSGDTLVVGAYKHGGNGAAYVYTRTAGVFGTEQKIVASDGAADDQFGESVAISGSTVVVGAHLDDIGSNVNQGSAYAYAPDSGGWAETKLMASDGEGGDLFGSAVAVFGDTIVVGAYRDDNARGDDAGAMYIYEPDGVVPPPDPPQPADGTASEFVSAGGTVDTDHDGNGATPDSPIETTVTTPNAGMVRITTGTPNGAPTGYSTLGPPISISAPPATPEDPLILVFRVDASILPEDLSNVMIFRDGVPVPMCTGPLGVASPDPCLLPGPDFPDGDISFTVYTSQASTWLFAVPEVFCHGEAPTIVGTADDDVLSGTDGDDVIWAGSGNDTVIARAGNDTICLGPGDDSAWGGPGRDVIKAGSGDDILRGGGGRDRLFGNRNDDRLMGGPGADRLKGGAGEDNLFGHGGDDRLNGNRGTDSGNGGIGDDQCISLETAANCESWTEPSPAPEIGP